MLLLSEFVGCSPSVSGAIRVNPWSVDDVADRIHEVHNAAASSALSSALSVSACVWARQSGRQLRVQGLGLD